MPVEIKYDKAWVSDVRTVYVGVSGAGPVYTPAGAAPIRPTRVDITYQMNGGLLGCQLRGEHADGRRIRRHMVVYGIQDVQFRANAPDWLIDLVEHYRPSVAS